MGGSIDLVVYSLASPVRRLPGSDKIVHAAIKPIGKPFDGATIDTEKDTLTDIHVDAATQQEIDETVSVLGGEDWALWTAALSKAGCLAEGARNIAFSYIGPEATAAMYSRGTIGRAKEHLEKTAKELGGRIAVMKSVVTQASAAIPVIPLYISVAHKVMKEKGLHEEPIDQTNRMFRDFLYRADGHKTQLDDAGRYRLDDRELREDVQRDCAKLWKSVTAENLMEVTDYRGYKQSFFKLFGFGRNDVDYEAETSIDVSFDCIHI
jgi:enoyl-[acyl-carrier protein] reductase/trans-2-enoyl-CoA reductase (NAD+)